jgi:hypothetical protein
MSSCAVGDEGMGAQGECLFGPNCDDLAADAAASGNVATLDAAPPAPTTDDVGSGELCGTGACSPDDATSCADFVPDAGLGTGSSPADAGGAPADAAADGGDASGTDASSDQDQSEAPAAPPPDAPVFACHVSHATAEPVPRCSLAGSVAAGESCEAARDCARGLACVTNDGAGLCLPYCCGGTALCAQGTYCAPRALHGAGAAGEVPVCTPAEQCGLDEPFPCAGDACACPTGAACTVVRDDGSTGCVRPGTGRAGDSCPCAAGHFCAPASATCLQVCQVDADAGPGCLAGRCQMAPGFPQGWGLCVGAAAESSR